MHTAYDWISIGIFTVLIVLFLQRSTSPAETVKDPFWMYLAGGIGCAIANYLGNLGMHLPAVLATAATVAFIFYFLKPFSSSTHG